MIPLASSMDEWMNVDGNERRKREMRKGAAKGGANK